MKTSYSYTSKIKFAVINNWNRTHSITSARAAAQNIPATVTCYKWIQEACGASRSFTRHSNGTKRRAVRLYYSSGRKMKLVSQRYNVAPNTVYRWIKQVSI